MDSKCPASNVRSDNEETDHQAQVAALIRTPIQRLELLTSLIEHYGKSKTPQMIASVGTMKKIRDELLDIEEGNAKPQDDAKNRCLDKIFESLGLVEYHRRKMEDHRRKMEMVSEESNGHKREFEQWLLVNRDATCQEVEEDDERKVETKD